MVKYHIGLDGSGGRHEFLSFAEIPIFGFLKILPVWAGRVNAWCH